MALKAKEKEWLDKACQWLRARNVLTDASIEGFRKVMEEQDMEQWKFLPKSRPKSILTRGQLQTLIVKGDYEILAVSNGECASDGITIKIDERDVEIR